MSIQSRKETVFLAPDHVLCLVAHADAVEYVEVRQWDHDDVVVALDETDSVTELAVIYEITLASHCADQLVLDDTPLEELVSIVDVKADRTLQILFFLLFFIVIEG